MTTARPTPGVPADLTALVQLARGHHRAGRLAEAADAYRKALHLRPDLADVHNDLGILLAQQGNVDAALAHLEQAVALKPTFAEGHNNLGIVLRSQGKLDQAEVHYRQSLALKPDYADAHNNLGNLLLSQGKLKQATACYTKALALRPGYAEAHNNLATALKDQGQLDKAAASYRQAIALRPNYAEAHNNLGSVLRELHQLDQAAASFEQAIALRPDLAEAHNNLGTSLAQRNQLDQATARYQQAIALRPDFAEAHNNLGMVLKDQGQLDQAAARYQLAISLRPDMGEAHLGLATCYLCQGDYERGWPALEGRRHIPGILPPTNLPRWNGQELAGRSLLLLAEQGLGDTIHFVRYARLLKQRGARVVLACQRALGWLLSSLPDLDELFFYGSADELPHCDFYLPLLSAPGALGTTAATIPHDVPYLAADPALADSWRGELAGIEGFKIGIAWQGSPDYRFDCFRSIPLSELAPLARVPGVRLLSLQKGFGSEQLTTVDFPVIDLASRLDEAAGPFMDTAAVIGGLDLVVSANTAIAHLAGALGAPVWVALQFSPDWRWLRDREETPWYPSMRLFRQGAVNRWDEVFERMAARVQARRP
ncbi:MAG TPA: tetratricopeptide repeat protein [Pirellulales bacterium]|jgi:Tfp pilus assembly protein PilF|nr:tetratricopeptide repeat protein [Pirellulales bacterium]